MARVKKNISGIDHLDDAALRWLNTDQGESSLKADLEDKWDRFLDSSSIETDGKMIYPKNSNKLGRWIAAASVIILLAMGGLWYYGNYKEKDPLISLISSDDVRLILPSGAEIILSSNAENGVIAKQGDVSLIRENGTLIHEKQDAIADSETELQWSSLEVPRKNQFDLVLEDGTRVWLNADSRLRFPIAFGLGERRVFIEGEAYFAVATDKERPFVVETPRQDITVSGTEFNVYAYPDELNERTTLIVGAVTLISRGNGSATLMPGQQAVLQHDLDEYFITEIDARNAATWRNGVFVFDGNTFGEVFLKLSRWYDFEYSFDDDELAQLTFSGNLRRFDDVEIIFEIIETIAPLKISVKEDRFRISKK